MPTPDRTTIKTAVDALVTALQTNLVADPPSGSRPFRAVLTQAAEPTASARPFMAVSLAKAEPIGVSRGDKLFAVTGVMRLVVDVTGEDTHAALLDAIGAVEDYLDSIVDTGVIEGASGFDDRVWTFEYPKSQAGARVAVAEARHAFVVRVERAFNRTAAP